MSWRCLWLPRSDLCLLPLLSSCLCLLSLLSFMDSRHRERSTDTELLPTGSFPKHSQQLGLGQAEPQSWGHTPGLPRGRRGPQRLGRHLLRSGCALAGSRIGREDWRLQSCSLIWDGVTGPGQPSLDRSLMNFIGRGPFPTKGHGLRL